MFNPKSNCLLFYFILFYLSNITGQGWLNIYQTLPNNYGIQVEEKTNIGYTITNEFPPQILNVDTEGELIQSISHPIASAIPTQDGNYLQSFSFNGEVILRKISVAGDTLWEKTYNDDEDIILKKIVETYDGNFWMLTNIKYSINNNFGILLWHLTEDGSIIEKKYEFYNTPYKHYPIFDAFVLSDNSLAYTFFDATNYWKRGCNIRVLNPDGSFKWQKEFGPGIYESVTSVVKTRETDQGGLIFFEVLRSLTIHPAPQVTTFYSYDNNGNKLFSKSMGNCCGHFQPAGEIAQACIPSNDTGILLISNFYDVSVGMDSLKFKKLNNNGGLIWERTMPKLFTANYGIQNSLGEYIITGEHRYSNNNYTKTMLAKLDSLGVLQWGSISGKIFIDENQNCQYDPTEIGLANSLLSHIGSNGLFSSTSNDTGHFTANTSFGDFITTTQLPSPYLSFCQDSITSMTSDTEPNDTIEIPLKSIEECPLVKIGHGAYKSSTMC